MLASRYPHALPAQTVARGVVEPARGVQSRRPALLDDPRPLATRALPVGQHAGRRAHRAGVGAGSARDAAGPAEALRLLGGTRHGRVTPGGGPRRSLRRAAADAHSGRTRGPARQARDRPGVARFRPRGAARGQRRSPAPGAADGAGLSASRPEVLAVGRRRGQRRRPAPALERQGATAFRARAARLAGRPQPGAPRSPARRRPQRARGAQGHRPLPHGIGRHREHLPEAPHRGRHPFDLRQLQRAQVRRPGTVVSASRTSSDGCSTTWSPRASSLS